METRLRRVTGPQLEPVTLDEVKTQIRLDHAEDDAFLTRIIKAAREHVESIAWRGIITQTWELVADEFPSCEIELPRGNLVSVTSVRYVDGAGVLQTLAGSEYSVDTVSVPGRILPAYGKTWPTSREQWDAVKVEYVVGWAQNAVPESLKQAILLVVSHMYEYRVSEITGTIVSEVRFAVDNLLEPHRLNLVG